MKAKITAQIAASFFRDDPKPRAMLWDTVLRGLYLLNLSKGDNDQGVVSGAWRYKYRTPDGRYRHYTVGHYPTLTPDQARTEARKVISALVQGGDPIETKRELSAERKRAKFNTLGGFIQNKYGPWVVSHRKSGKQTVALLDAYFAHLYTRPLSDITPWVIERWRNDALHPRNADARPLKPVSVNRVVTALKAALSKAVEWGVIESHPLAKVKPLKVDDKGKVRYLSEDEEARLRAALDRREATIRAERKNANGWRSVRGYPLLDDMTGKRFADHIRPLVLLALNTGMRRGELFALTWGCVDLAGRFLTVAGETAKSGKTRHVPLNDEAFGVLVAWRNQTEGGDLVFPSPVTGNRLDNINSAWEGVLSDAGVTGFRFHDCRHHFASRLVMAGVPLNTVRELLGHSSIEMTLRYAHLAPENKIAAVALLNQAWRP